MRWITIISILFSTFLFTAPVQAQAPTKAETNDPVSEKLDEQINELKEKIASRVSELDLVEKRGIIGTVEEVESNQITLQDVDGDTRFVDVDEITKFSSSDSKANFGISDLKAGVKISVLGNYNKQSKRILARFVETHVVPTRYSGNITKIDAKNFQITLKVAEAKEVKIDIDTTTDAYAYTKEAGLVQYGFSKLADGDRVIVLGYPDQDDADLLVASRLIDFINIPSNPRIDTAEPTTAQEQVTIAPTGAGGRTIDPIN